MRLVNEDFKLDKDIRIKILENEVKQKNAEIKFLEDNRHFLNKKIDKVVKYLKKELKKEEPLLVEYEIETLLDILKGEE